jgi:DNA-binding CsgD family transcriptional regulator
MRFTPGPITGRPQDNAISAQEWETLRRSLGLSLLQSEIMTRLVQGKSYPEIAREMALRPRTVRTVVNRLYREFGVAGRVQLILHVLTVLHEHWEQRRESPGP